MNRSKIIEVRGLLEDKADKDHTHVLIDNGNLNVNIINNIAIASPTQYPTGLVGKPIIPIIKSEGVMEVCISIFMILMSSHVLNQYLTKT